jgi:hypothetical protein
LKNKPYVTNWSWLDCVVWGLLVDVVIDGRQVHRYPSITFRLNLYYFVTLIAIFGLIPPRLDLTCNPAAPEVPAAGCGAPFKVRLQPLPLLVKVPADPGSNVALVIVRYCRRFKTTLMLFDVAAIVKVFFERLYDADLIATVSVNATGFTVMVVLAALVPTEFVAVSVRIIVVLAVTAGAV